jgi:hypothetical protein
MSLSPPHGYQEIERVFGQCAKDGQADPDWVKGNIVGVKPPQGWRLYYDNGAKVVPTSGLAVHRLVQEPLLAALRDVWAYAHNQAGAGAAEELVRAWLHERRLDVTGGGYSFRPKRGGSGLSLHSWGIAIDWDPRHNPRQKPLTKTLPDWWYGLWAARGWSDGRGFATPDPMHVQFATGA